MNLSYFRALLTHNTVEILGPIFRILHTYFAIFPLSTSFSYIRYVFVCKVCLCPLSLWSCGVNCYFNAYIYFTLNMFSRILFCAHVNFCLRYKSYLCDFGVLSSMARVVSIRHPHNPQPKHPFSCVALFLCTLWHGQYSCLWGIWIFKNNYLKEQSYGFI